MNPPPVVLYAASVQELLQFEYTDSGLIVGAGVTISSLQQQLNESLKQHPGVEPTTLS